MRFILFVLLLATAGLAHAADTLVTKGADGKIGPGAAKSWKVTGGTVTFALAAGADGPAIAQFLTARLANAQVKLEGGALVISGIPAEALLDQLSAMSLSGGGDPLADLAGMGGAAVAMDTPEGGGSIRAAKPNTTAFATHIKDHDAGERIEVEVIEAKRGTFPEVTLKLKVRRVAKSGPLKKKLKSGQVIEAAVLFHGSQAGIDLWAGQNQRNLAAFYVSSGDRITVHPVAREGDAIAIDWIERK
ncbi:MAG: hypothetical protein HYZ27_00320 [Deltaproteobacteria bacterium]|nr:hypothetical protein [Deltaproteobacteria bacterium]